MSNSKMTLPTDSAERKDYPLMSGCLNYFPAALAGVALISKKGNDKHNPGQALHHARNKSMDHGDCILRHLVDTQDLLAAFERSGEVPNTHARILEEVSCLAWRALALSQELHEKFGAPLAPGAVQEQASKVAPQVVEQLEFDWSTAIDYATSHHQYDNEFGPGVSTHKPLKPYVPKGQP